MFPSAHVTHQRAGIVSLLSRANSGDSGGYECIMRVGHVFVGLVFLWALLESERLLNNISLTSRHLTSWCNQGAFFRLETLPSAEEIGVFGWSFCSIGVLGFSLLCSF